MEKFNAKQAREIVDALYANELSGILASIKNVAAIGKTTLYVNKPLQDKTLEGLRGRGFEVEKANGMATQRDGWYYAVLW